MVRILIADDHPILREGLKRILAGEADLKVAGEARNTQEVLELARKQDWDAIVLDISMPGRGGLEVLKELKHERPKLPVLILSMHPEDQFAIRAFRAGAAGYMTKESAPEELIKALRKILNGGRYVSPSLAEKMAFQLDIGTEQALHENLSDREYQVMTLIASGKTVSQIAEELSLSVKTISTYRARILEKMNLMNNAQLTYYAIRNGLV